MHTSSRRQESTCFLLMTPRWHWRGGGAGEHGRRPAASEELPDVAALDEFVRTWGWTGDRTRDEAELRGGPRPAAPAAPDLAADEDEVVAIVNGLLREAARCPSWSSTTSGTTTCTPPRPRRRWPPGWRSRRPWRSVDVVPQRRARPAAHLRVADLRGRGGGPVEEPVEAILRGQLRQPGGGGRLPRPPGHGPVSERGTLSRSLPPR